MPTSKRVILLLIRCATVIMAVGFLVFYVWRARENQSGLFSGSKSSRALFSGEKPTMENPEAHAAPPAPDNAPLVSPLSSPQSLAIQDMAPEGDPFSFSIFPPRPVTLGGSKSLVPTVKSSDLFPPWTGAPKITTHSLDLPALRTLPPEVTFSEPKIRVEVVAGEQNEPAPHETGTTMSDTKEPVSPSAP